MQVSYGPPGHRGVTHLMAVGDDDMASTPPIEKALIVGAIATGAAHVLGAKKLTGWAAIGIAVLGVMALAKKTSHTVVATTAPAPAPASDYIAVGAPALTAF